MILVVGEWVNIIILVLDKVGVVLAGDQWFDIILVMGEWAGVLADDVLVCGFMDRTCT